MEDHSKSAGELKWARLKEMLQKELGPDDLWDAMVLLQSIMERLEKKEE
ncbi:MAG: hypothetical protein DDT19_00065 [Syntrophomonadaceae bacterium]|nr:hypothetical protein [Bacillota bacterium]